MIFSPPESSNNALLNGHLQNFKVVSFDHKIGCHCRQTGAISKTAPKQLEWSATACIWGGKGNGQISPAVS